MGDSYRALFEALFAGKLLRSREFFDGDEKRNWYRYRELTDDLEHASVPDGRTPQNADWYSLGWSMAYHIDPRGLEIVGARDA